VVVVVVLIAGASAVWAGSASAAPCGSTDPKTGTPLRGTLILNQEQAVTDAVFKRKTGHKTLALIFSVTGCEVATDAPQPALDIGPRKNTDELPDNALPLRRVVPDGTALEVDLNADTAKFKPGSYGALVALRAPYLVTSRTPVSVSRSENRVLIPLGWGALAALVGIFLYSLRFALQRKKPNISVGWGAVVVLVGAAVGAVLVLVSWGAQDVWTFGDNWKSSGVIGLSGATSGVMAGFLGSIWGNGGGGGNGRAHDEVAAVRVPAGRPS
jgi:hypothetical protein